MKTYTIQLPSGKKMKCAAADKNIGVQIFKIMMQKDESKDGYIRVKN